MRLPEPTKNQASNGILVYTLLRYYRFTTHRDVEPLRQREKRPSW